jgi:hypothetical protein
MDKSTFDGMTAQLEMLHEKYEARVRKLAKETHMPEGWVRPIAKAQVSLESLQGRVAAKMGALPEDAEHQAYQVAGDPKLDAEMIEKYGVSHWAFARSYLMLQKIDDFSMDDSPFPALFTVSQVASTLMLAMEVLDRDQRARNGAKGGQISASVTADVRVQAIMLARQHEPEGGWPSAPKAAEGIFPLLLPYARGIGRSPSRRIVEQWLRAAGIKRKPT